MLERILNIPKKKWIIAHVIILAIAVAWVMYLFGQHEVVTYEGPRLVYQTHGLAGMLFYTGVAIVAGVVIFPAFIMNSLYYITNTIDASFVNNYYILTLFLIPIILSLIYYTLWLVPDDRWDEKKSKYVQIIRIVWFFLALSSVLFFSNMF